MTSPLVHFFEDRHSLGGAAIVSTLGAYGVALKLPGFSNKVAAFCTINVFHSRLPWYKALPDQDDKQDNLYAS